MAYAALTTARLGLRSAAVVGADAIAAGAAELDLLRAAGVTVRVVPLVQGPVFKNVETPGGRVQTCVEPGDPLPVVAVPESWVAAPTWLVVPVAGETGPGWAAAVPPGARLALGWQGLLRVLVAGERVRRRPPISTALVARADLVGVSRHDLEPGTRVEALVFLLRPDARLVVTEGRAGGIVVERDGGGGKRVERYTAIKAAEVDSTGAGDVFLAALSGAMSGRGTGPVDAGDLRWAAAAAALVVEGVGLDAVPDRATVSTRLVRETASRPGPVSPAQ